MTIRILYFARLRDVLRTGEEELALPEGTTLAGLVALLVARGGDWAAEFGGARVFRAAINQDMARPDDVIPAGAEVALFPPVTGG
ncbi:molybdopterin converting factor subunit 1 [Chitinilyticum litopenaei]|uniref:Molybdopterin synthase sulfur carrier subunit n=2 Tax=Chitinilyticum piscinae TaxID=2866724 RepID=A0A8J7FQC2_9NEIS|nr:molybdopterin converting factor subunit 1 [Chitinilyticum piscinae]